MQPAPCARPIPVGCSSLQDPRPADRTARVHRIAPRGAKVVAEQHHGEMYPGTAGIVAAQQHQDPVLLRNIDDVRHGRHPVPTLGHDLRSSRKYDPIRIRIQSDDTVFFPVILLYGWHVCVLDRRNVSPNPLNSPISLPFFLLRPRKRAKKKGAARRGAGFSVKHLIGANGNPVPCHGTRPSQAMLPDGIARKNPQHHHPPRDWTMRRYEQRKCLTFSRGTWLHPRPIRIRRGNPCGCPPNGCFGSYPLCFFVPLCLRVS